MTSDINPHLATRLALLQQTIPTATRKRTNRGILATCRELTDHLRRINQLWAYVENKADSLAIESLIAKIDRYREELTDKGRLCANVRADREQRRQNARL